MTKSTYVDELRAKIKRLSAGLECALLKDSLKTREINVLVPENRRLRAELERVKKQAAAMHYALKEMRRVAVCGGNSPDGPDVACAVDELLRSSDAGRGYISREQVKPLVEALEELDNMLAMRGPGDNPYAVVRRALEHAGALDL